MLSFLKWEFKSEWPKEQIVKCLPVFHKCCWRLQAKTFSNLCAYVHTFRSVQETSFDRRSANFLWKMLHKFLFFLVSLKIVYVVLLTDLDIPVIAPSGTPKVSEGQKLSLSCSVSSHPEAVFTWFNSTNLVGNGKTLTLNSVLRARAGRYTCKAKNVFGEKTSAPSQVIVKCK